MAKRLGTIAYTTVYVYETASVKCSCINSLVHQRSQGNYCCLEVSCCMIIVMLLDQLAVTVIVVIV